MKKCRKNICDSEGKCLVDVIQFKIKKNQKYYGGRDKKKHHLIFFEAYFDYEK